jgi:hypothetical protein
MALVGWLVVWLVG